MDSYGPAIKQEIVREVCFNNIQVRPIDLNMVDHGQQKQPKHLQEFLSLVDEVEKNKPKLWEPE